MAYTTILFDLDGTLTDSKEGIFNCLRHAFAELGLPCPEEDVLRRFIGPPLPDSLVRFCGMGEQHVSQAMNLFQTRYQAAGKFENTPAPGMLALCKALHAKGYSMGLASSKPEIMCVDICEKFGFTPYFQVVAGSSLEEHGTKADVIVSALDRMGVTDRATVLMVGDRKFDVLGAKECAVDCVGVEFFDYAEPGELMEAGAVAVVKTTQELEAWILAQ